MRRPLFLRRDCRVARERFIERLTVGLPERQERQHADHVAGCLACRDACAELLDAWSGLPQYDDMAPPARVRDTVMAGAREALTGAEESFARRADSAPRGRHQTRMARLLLPLAGFGAAVAAVFALLMLTADEPRVTPGREVPDIQARLVATGALRSLSDYRGDVVLLHVWATWCIPCEQEMASLEQLEERLRAGGLRVLAVSVDRETRYRVQNWAAERGLGLTLLHDPTDQLERLYQLIGVPETFIIGPDGVLLWRAFGPRDWDDPAQVELVEGFLRIGSAS